MNARLTLAAIMIAAAVAAAMAILTGARLTSGRPPHFVGTEKPVTVGSMEIAEHCAPDSETVLEQPE